MRKHNESSRRYANSKKVTQLVNVEEHVEGFRQSERHIGASLLMITLS